MGTRTRRTCWEHEAPAAVVDGSSKRCGRHPASVSRDELSVIAHKPVARHDVRTWRVQAAFDATVEHVGLDAASSVPGVVHVYVDVSEFA